MLAKLEKQRERLVRLYADADDDKFPVDVLEREIARVESERKSALAMIADIDTRITEQDALIVQLDDVRTWCERAGANIDDADFTTKRIAVEALVDRIEANGRDWTLHGSIPIGTNAGGVSITS
jgi:DNA repair exonuclease SbcCD ATPase subunit